MAESFVKSFDNFYSHKSSVKRERDRHTIGIKIETSNCKKSTQARTQRTRRIQLRQATQNAKKSVSIIVMRHLRCVY